MKHIIKHPRAQIDKVIAGLIGCLIVWSLAGMGIIVL
jgi:hypothetical protein